tara:strand:+ start:277 stop:582 length:306 start_codon:yes stop_codon:yes gene_type:complete
MVHLQLEKRLNSGITITNEGYITKYKEVTAVPNQMLLFFTAPTEKVKSKDLMFWDKDKLCFCTVQRSDEVNFKNHKFLGHIDNVRTSGGILQLLFFPRNSY